MIDLDDTERFIKLVDIWMDCVCVFEHQPPDARSDRRTWALSWSCQLSDR
jgi:hypothetical protein